MNKYEVRIDQLYSYHFIVEARSEEEARASAGWRLFFDNRTQGFNEDSVVLLIEEDV